MLNIRLRNASVADLWENRDFYNVYLFILIFSRFGSEPWLPFFTLSKDSSSLLRKPGYGAEALCDIIKNHRTNKIKIGL